jgi:hypothetical protein
MTSAIVVTVAICLTAIAAVAAKPEWRDGLHVPAELHARFGLMAPAMALTLVTLTATAALRSPTSRLTHGA